MSAAEKRQKEPKKQTCFAEYVVDVPQTIVNPKMYTAYKCSQFLGSGSYSKCFEVVRPLSSEHYACKVLSKVMIQDINLKRLVQNEIKLHSQLKHNHVVEFIESFNDEKHIYMIQSLCSNHSLRELVKHRGVVNIHECRYFINQILKGVEYIHKMRIIHRDLKLGNVLIDHDMQMKIGDFGLAIESTNPRVSSKSLCGTTNYLAPEVVERKGFAFGTDIWAVGVIAFVLLYGYTPFEEHDALETYKRISHVDYYLPSDLDDDAKHFFKSVLVKDLSRRLNAEECMQLPFFMKHIIPPALADDVFGQPNENIDFTFPEPTSNLNVNSAMTIDGVDVVYPEIRIVAQPKLCCSDGNTKYAHVFDRIYERFDAICRFHDTQGDFSFNNITETAESEPEYWIGKWFLDYCNGLVYQISDKTFGMLFHNGLKFRQFPDKVYSVCEPGHEWFQELNEVLAKSDEELRKFRELKHELKKVGHFEAETPFNRANSPHLYTWFQTNEAIIMLLSNKTFQINFTKSHKKMLICPQNETVTLVNGKITRANSKTMSFTTLATQNFSAENFQMLKYVTACLNVLAMKLAASGTSENE